LKTGENVPAGEGDKGKKTWKKAYFCILKVTSEKAESGSLSKSQRSEDKDPYQNVRDPEQHCP
jgi:hypothetical protein